MKRTSKSVTIETMQSLRQYCRSIGLTQETLAKTLKVSLPTLKRWFTGKGVTLDNLFLLLDTLGLTMQDLARMSPGKDEEAHTFTIEQEDGFLRHPGTLNYLYQLLGGYNPKRIEEKFGISHRSTRRYLKALEGLNLIQVFPGDKVRFLFNGRANVRPDGELAQKIRGQMYREFMDTRTASPGKLSYMTLTVHHFLEEDAQYVDQKIKELNGHVRTAIQRSLTSSGKKKDYGLLLGFGPFTPSFLRDVTDY